LLNLDARDWNAHVTPIDAPEYRFHKLAANGKFIPFRSFEANFPRFAHVTEVR
jgi:hypothetical protein